MSAERAGRVCDVALLVLALALPLSIAVSELALGVVLLSWLATRPWSRPASRGIRRLAWATAALAAAWFLSCVTAADPLASFVNLRKLYSIALVFVVADRAREARIGDRLAVAALVGGALSAFHGLLSFAFHRVVRAMNWYRLEGVFSTAMTTGNVYSILAIAALGEFVRRPASVSRLLAHGAGFALLGLALLGTLTRSSWLGFLVGSMLILGRLRARWLLLALVAGAVIVGLGPGELRDRVASTFDPTYETNAGRISLWRSGIAVVRDHPWTGVGLADHYDLIQRYRRPDATFKAGHFHNNVVQIAVSTGLIGLAAYLAWMLTAAALLVASVRSGNRGRALVGLAVWIGFQVAGMFDWSFGDIEVVNQFYLWLGLGLAAASSRAVVEAPRSS